MLLQMQSDYKSRDRFVAGENQATAFHNQLRSQLLIACVMTDKNLSQLKAELDAPLSKLHYHVEKLISLGLLQVSRSEPRAGRSIRYFRAVARQFLVPQALMPALPGDAWSEELRRALHNDYILVDEISLLYAPDEQGKLFVRLVRSEASGPPRSFEIWRKLHLDAQQRAAFRAELETLIDRYAKTEPGNGSREYLAHAAFAPRPEI